MYVNAEVAYRPTPWCLFVIFCFLETRGRYYNDVDCRRRPTVCRLL